MIDLTFFSPVLPASPGPQNFAEPQVLPASEANFATVFDAHAALLSGPPVAETDAIDLPLLEADVPVESEMHAGDRALSAGPANEVALAAAHASFQLPEPVSVRAEFEEPASRHESSLAEPSGDPFFDIVLLTEQLVQTLGSGEMAFEGVRDSFQTLRADLATDFEWEVPAEEAPVMIEESNPFDSIAVDFVSMPAGAPEAILPAEDSLPASEPKATAAETEAIAQAIPEIVIEPAQVIAVPLPAAPIAPSGETGRPSPKTLDEMPSAEPAKIPAMDEIREPEPDSLFDQTVLLMPVTPPQVWMEKIPAAPEIKAENGISAPQAVPSDSVPASMPAVETFTAPAAGVSPDLPSVFDRDGLTKEIPSADATPGLKASNPKEGTKPAIQAASNEFLSLPSPTIRQAAPDNLPPVERPIPRPQPEAVNPALPPRSMEMPLQEAGLRPQSPPAEAGQGDFVSLDQKATPPVLSPGEFELVPVENKLPEAPQGFSEPVVIEPGIIEPGIIEPDVIEPGIIEPDVIEPVVIEPVVIEPGVIEPGVIEPGVIEPGVIEPGVIEPGVIEPGVIEPGVIENATPQQRNAAPVEPGPRPVSSESGAAENEPLISQPRPEKTVDAPIEMKEPATRQSPIEAAPVQKLDIAISSDEAAWPQTGAPAIERASAWGEPRGPEPLEHRAEDLFEATARGGEEVAAIRREGPAVVEFASAPPVESDAVLSAPSIARPVSRTQLESVAPASPQSPKDAPPEISVAPVVSPSVSSVPAELATPGRNEAFPDRKLAEADAGGMPQRELPVPDSIPQGSSSPATPRNSQGPVVDHKPLSDAQGMAAPAPRAQAVQLPVTEIEAPAPIEGLRYERLESIAFRESFRPEVMEEVFRSVATATEPADTLRTDSMRSASPQLPALQSADPQPFPAEESAQLVSESAQSAMMIEAGSPPPPRASMQIASARSAGMIRPGRASLRITDALRATENAIAPVHEEAQAAAAPSQESAALPEPPVSQDMLPGGPREFTPLTIVPERNQPVEKRTDPNSSPAGEDALVAAIDAPESRARLVSEGTGRMQAERNAFRSLRMESQPRRAAVDAEAAGAPVSFSAIFAEQASLQTASEPRADLPESIARQVAEPMVEAAEHLPAGNSRSLRLTLRPEEFGQVELQITRDADGRVHAVFAAERESASQALHEGIPHLRESLERAGLQVDQLIVHTGGQTMSYGQGAEQQTPNRDFLPTRSSDSFEAEALPPGGEPTADDRLLNVHA